MNDRIKCPYCNKEDFVPYFVTGNIDAYGSNSVNFKCNHCHKVVHAYGRRVVILTDIRQTDSQSDWGE